MLHLRGWIASLLRRLLRAPSGARCAARIFFSRLSRRWSAFHTGGFRQAGADRRAQSPFTHRKQRTPQKSVAQTLTIIEKRLIRGQSMGEEVGMRGTEQQQSSMSSYISDGQEHHQCLARSLSEKDHRLS